MSDQSIRKKRYRKHKKELFFHYREILILIHKEKEWYYNQNQIFEELRKRSKKDKNQTGLGYKQNILDSLNALEKIGLIEIKRKGKQEKIIRLTQSGMETAVLITALENYDKSYMKLIAVYDDKLFLRNKRFPYRIDLYLRLIDKNIRQRDYPDTPLIEENLRDLRMTLLEKGWKKEELPFYNEIKANLIDFRTLCEKNYFFIISRRFAKILNENKINSPVLFRFFNYLIMKPMEEKVNIILNNLDEDTMGHLIVRTRQTSPKLLEAGSSHIGGVFQLFQELYDTFDGKIISFVFWEEVSDMVYSYLNLIQAPMGNVDISHIDNLKESIAKLRIIHMSNLKGNDKIQLKLIIKTKEFLCNTLISYAGKKNIPIVTFHS